MFIIFLTTARQSAILPFNMPNILETIKKVQEGEQEILRSRTQEKEEHLKSMVTKFGRLVEETGVKTELKTIADNLLKEKHPDIFHHNPDKENPNHGRLTLEWKNGPDEYAESSSIDVNFYLEHEKMEVIGDPREREVKWITCVPVDKEMLHERLAKAFLKPEKHLPYREEASM